MTDTSFLDSETFRQAGARATLDQVCSDLLVVAAFGLYWLSSFDLESSHATIRFGADSWLYSELAQSDVFSRIPTSDHLERIARFHPLTVAMAAAWMEIVSPLTHWVPPLHLLKAMFAAVGAAGVWAAMSAFSAVVPQRYVLPLGMVYAVSFGVWFFASIEESKIVSATLAALYIAGYLHLRNGWTTRGAVWLTAILLLACLNEMVAGFLVIIPVVDTLMRRGWDWRHYRWIAAHALAGPLAFIVVEGALYSLLPAPTSPEGNSHLELFLFYLSEGYRDAGVLYSFVINWLFFNLAAPTADAPHWVPPGFFEPALANYLASPASAALVALFVVMVIAGASAWRQAAIGSDSKAIIAALLVYVALRGAFFFLFRPPEPLLFATSVTLALTLVIALPFLASNIPAKRTAVWAAAGLLLITNGAFIFGQ